MINRDGSSVAATATGNGMAYATASSGGRRLKGAK